MSVPSRCIAVGVLVFLYWAEAFAAALMSLFAGPGELRLDEWWNAAWLREPGSRVGESVFELLAMALGWDYPRWPLFPALFLTAVGMGTGAWLLSGLVSGWWMRRKQYLAGMNP